MKLLNLFVPHLSFLTLVVFVSLVSIAFCVESSANDLGKKASTRYDFDGDGKADLSVFLPASGKWFLDQSELGYSELQLGQEGDIPVAADYDGDGKTDLAFFREGSWYRLKSSTNTFDTARLGIPEDIPAPADFDGDGLADLTIFRPSKGQWLLIPSTDETNIKAVNFGQKGDIPAVADYDGDNQADIAVFRPSNGTWYRLGSGDSKFEAIEFGQSEDLPFPADFDGDGKADLAVWHSTDATWFIRHSDGSQTVMPLGLATDLPIPADYDGDRKTDIAVWRNSNKTRLSINSLDGTQATRPARSLTNPPDSSSTEVPLTGTPTPTPTWKRKPKITPTPTPPPVSFTCDYVASPTGTSTGTGSITNPWNLHAALNKTNLVTSGKTLCLRGGTYYGKFTSTLNGGTVRSYPGEWAVIDGYATTTLAGDITSSQTSVPLTSSAGLFSGSTIVIDSETLQIGSTVVSNTVSVNRHWDGTTAAAHTSGTPVYFKGKTLAVTGSNTRYIGFEIRNSNTNRNYTTGPGSTNDLGLFNLGNANDFINLIIHDNGYGGIFTGSSSSNTTVYGCLVYNNGMTNGGSGYTGHGLYIENASGYSRIYDTIVLNSFNLGAQFYGQTGPYVGGDLRGLVIAGSGEPVNQRHWNLIYGPDAQQSPTANIDSCVFHHPSGDGYSVQVGYGRGVAEATVTNNYFLGAGGSGLSFSVRKSNMTFTGNKFDSLSSGTRYGTVDENPLGTHTWDNNTYYNTTAGNSSRFAIPGVGTGTFASWKARYGYDANSTIVTGAMPDTVIVRPNIYESGRANVTIYAPSAPTSINVDLSTSGLTNGQAYAIKNAYNYFGSDVLRGIYSSGSPIVSVPLTGAASSVATPTGMGSPPDANATFFVLIVKPD